MSPCVLWYIFHNDLCKTNLIPGREEAKMNLKTASLPEKTPPSFSHHRMDDLLRPVRPCQGKLRFPWAARTFWERPRWPWEEIIQTHTFSLMKCRRAPPCPSWRKYEYSLVNICGGKNSGNEPGHGGRQGCQIQNACMTDKRVSTHFMHIEPVLMVDSARRNWAKPYKKFIAFWEHRPIYGGLISLMLMKHSVSVILDTSDWRPVCSNPRGDKDLLSPLIRGTRDQFS